MRTTDKTIMIIINLKIKEKINPKNSKILSNKLLPKKTLISLYKNSVCKPLISLAIILNL